PFIPSGRPAWVSHRAAILVGARRGPRVAAGLRGTRAQDSRRGYRMTEFQYGDPHPSGVPGAARIPNALARLASHFLGVLAGADDVYLRGHDGVAAGLAQFDQELENIRTGWEWAAEQR